MGKSTPMVYYYIVRNKIFIFIGGLIVLTVFALWFFGSGFFPLLTIPDQYLGESIYIKRAIALSPALLVIYQADNFPNLLGMVETRQLSPIGVYGNFDMSLTDSSKIEPGNYIGVMYTNWSLEKDLTTKITGIAHDLMGRQEVVRFKIK